MKKLLVLTALILFSGITFSQTLTEEEMKALANRYVEAYNVGDLSIFDEIISPEIVQHNIEGDIIGIEAFKESAASLRTAYPDIKLSFDELILKGDKIVTRWTITGTNTGPSSDLPPTGKNIKVSGVTIGHIINGKTNEEWVYYNGAAVLNQLGFKITPPEIQSE
jgi:steroid delta-isomerase-like uncharacterized protein